MGNAARRPRPGRARSKRCATLCSGQGRGPRWPPPVRWRCPLTGLIRGRGRRRLGRPRVCPLCSCLPCSATAVMLGLFGASVTRAPDSVAIRYFGGVLTMADLDARSGSLALALAVSGVAAGDRLGGYVQNNPAFAISLVAAWKAGGAAVVINPMNKRRELACLLADSGAGALLCLDDLYGSVAREAIATGETAVRTVITCSRWTSSPAPTSGCSPARSGCVRRGRWTSGRSSAG